MLRQTSSLQKSNTLKPFLERLQLFLLLLFLIRVSNLNFNQNLDQRLITAPTATVILVHGALHLRIIIIFSMVVQFKGI